VTVISEKKPDTGDGTAEPVENSGRAGEVDDKDVDEITAEDTEESQEPEQQGRRRWPRRVLIGSMALMFVILLAACGFLGWTV
jgi:hypothetical protein